MAATQWTRTHSFRLGRTLAMVGIALALVMVAFAARAAVSLAQGPESWLPPTPVTVVPTTSPIQDPTLTPDPTPAPTPAPTPTPDPRHTGKVIVVSIAEQRLTAYQDGAIVLTTPVATGRPALPTPTGTFHIMSKAAPYKFISPWPRGDQYWYPTEWVSYAMQFADDGYFLHDAPWRIVYGPGANATNGTHGCINIPTAAMANLYRWAAAGTTVIVD